MLSFPKQSRYPTLSHLNSGRYHDSLMLCSKATNLLYITDDLFSETLFMELRPTRSSSPKLWFLEEYRYLLSRFSHEIRVQLDEHYYPWYACNLQIYTCVYHLVRIGYELLIMSRIDKVLEAINIKNIELSHWLYCLGNVILKKLNKKSNIYQFDS
jgi:hypothetical protein